MEISGRFGLAYERIEGGTIGNPVADVAISVLILSGVSVSKPSYRSLIDQFNEAY